MIYKETYFKSWHKMFCTNLNLIELIVEESVNVS